MGIELNDTPKLGEPFLTINYQRIGETVTSMDPTVARSIDDRDRMDWLERSITAIRQVLNEQGLRVTEAESGYGRIMGRINDLNAATESQRAEAGVAVHKAIEVSEMVIQRIEELAGGLVDFIATNKMALDNVTASVSSQQELLFKQLEQIQAEATNRQAHIVEALMQQSLVLMEITNVGNQRGQQLHELVTLVETQQALIEQFNGALAARETSLQQQINDLRVVTEDKHVTLTQAFSQTLEGLEKINRQLSTKPWWRFWE